ncbi:acyl-CoA dehydrogenase family protein, partial [Mycobacteroides sp. H101]|uniref:acyl-CoA dehydrogenase family protein n=1 Tax=Mycobacteroides sp. H101 TaxID=1720574 RepID=UPI000AFCB278
MEISESQERRDLRAAVAAIGKSYGHDYYLTKSLGGEKSTELWQEVGKQGFLGVNIAEEYGGGGA